jgi:hypothetical protein
MACIMVHLLNMIFRTWVLNFIFELTSWYRALDFGLGKAFMYSVQNGRNMAKTTNTYGVKLEDTEGRP